MLASKADRPPANLLAQIRKHSQVRARYDVCDVYTRDGQTHPKPKTLHIPTYAQSIYVSIYTHHNATLQVIVDTADYLQLEALPLVTEATTNPSIVWQAAQQEKYFHLLQEACEVRNGCKTAAHGSAFGYGSRPTYIYPSLVINVDTYFVTFV